MTPSPIHPAILAEVRVKPDPAILAEVCAKNAPKLFRIAETLQRAIERDAK